MAKIKIAVAGCLGRMGQEISKQILQIKNLEFVGGFEHKKHKDINKPFNKVSSRRDYHWIYIWSYRFDCQKKFRSRSNNSKAH